MIYVSLINWKKQNKESLKLINLQLEIIKRLNIEKQNLRAELLSYNDTYVDKYGYTRYRKTGLFAPKKR